MIWFIIGCAIIMFLSCINVFEQDLNQYTRAIEKLKWTCQNASTDGSYFYNLEDYGNGRLVFDYDDSLSSIKQSVRDSLDLDSSLKALTSSYWVEPFTCDVFFYDESNIMRHYSNFVLQSQISFNFPTQYVDSLNNFTTDIFEPTVVVRLTTANRPSRLNGIPEFTLTRTASSESPGR